MHQIFENEAVLSMLLLTGLIVAVVLGNFVFHTLTKGNHFREWKEFEPLDAPTPKEVTWATVQRYRELRGTAYSLLVKTLSLTLNCPEDQVTSEHVVYAVLEHFSPNCVPNSAIDNNDIKFTTEVNKVILRILNTKASELRKFMQETFPNQNF